MDKMDRMTEVLKAQGYAIVIHDGNSGERSCRLDTDNLHIVIWGDAGYQKEKLEECYEIICKKEYSVTDYRAVNR